MTNYTIFIKDFLDIYTISVDKNVPAITEPHILQNPYDFKTLEYTNIITSLEIFNKILHTVLFLKHIGKNYMIYTDSLECLNTLNNKIEIIYKPQFITGLYSSVVKFEEERLLLERRLNNNITRY